MFESTFSSVFIDYRILGSGILANYSFNQLYIRNRNCSSAISKKKKKTESRTWVPRYSMVNLVQRTTFSLSGAKEEYSSDRRRWIVQISNQKKFVFFWNLKGMLNADTVLDLMPKASLYSKPHLNVSKHHKLFNAWWTVSLFCLVTV